MVKGINIALIVMAVVTVTLGCLRVVNYGGWWDEPEPTGIAFNSEGVTLAGQYTVISPWPGGNHIILPNNTVIHIGNATAIFREVNGVIVIEGVKIK
jgi:hypothetical protein